MNLRTAPLKILAVWYHLIGNFEENNEVPHSPNGLWKVIKSNWGVLTSVMKFSLIQFKEMNTESNFNKAKFIPCIICRNHRFKSLLCNTMLLTVDGGLVLFVL